MLEGRGRPTVDRNPEPPSPVAAAKQVEAHILLLMDKRMA
jgi:hypothetical protein